MVDCDADRAFEVLAGACGELKAKMHDIDTLRHRIDGKSKTTAMRWGTKFHARVISHSATVVEVYDTALLTDDRFIKQLYRTFTKYQSASPLEIEPLAKEIDFKNKVDEYLGDNEPMPSEGAPLMAADIPDEVAGRLPASRAICKNCGHAPEEGMSFCTKCGTKLD